jgi:hypothetical protein
LTHIANGHYSLVTIAGNTDTLGSLRIDCNKATYQIPPVEGEVLPATVFDALVTNAAGGANGLLLSLASNQVDVGKLLGTAWLAPGTAGTPDVNVKLWNALTTVALPLIPTTAGRTLDCSATGEAGVDWANVGSPTTTVNFSGTTIKTATDIATAVDAVDNFVDTEIADIQARLPAALTAGGLMKSDSLAINAVLTTAVTTVKAVQGLAVDGVITTLTNLPAITSNWLTAAGIATGALNGKGDWNTTTPPTTAAIATGVWQDTTAGDFTVALSIGKSILNGVTLGTGLTINAYTGNTPQTGDSYAVVNSGTFGNSALKTLIDAVDNFVDTEIADIQARIPAALGANGNIKSDVRDLLGTAWLTPGTAGTPDVNTKLAGGTAWASGSLTSGVFASGAINAAAIATDAIGASELAADAIAEIADQVWDEILSGHAIAGSTGAALSAAGSAGDPWSTALPGAYGAGTAGQIVGDNVNATISSRASQASVDIIDDFLDTEIAAILAAVDTEVADIRTAVLTTIPATLAALLTTSMTEAYRADGATGSVAKLLYELIAHHGESGITGTTKTIKKLDGSTTAATFTLDSATTPTSITRAT